MAGKKKKKDSWINGGFVAVTFEMMDSKAFKELTGNAVRALILCMRKVKEDHYVNRFRVNFSLTYPEARKKGFCDVTFSRVIKQLQHVGFIDCIMKGGLTCGSGKVPSVYRLSQRWKNYGNPDFEVRQPGHCRKINDPQKPF